MEMEFDYDLALASDKNITQSDIDHLRDFIQRDDYAKNSIIPRDLTDKDLLVFYHACRYNMDDTISCMSKFFKCKAESPELFDNLTMELPEDVMVSKSIECCYFPVKTKDGDNIILHRFCDYNPSNYDNLAGTRLSLMTLDACIHENGPAAGMVFIFDYYGTTFGHIPKVNISMNRKFFYFIQNAMPLRIKEIHLINAPFFYNLVWTIVKPFIHTELFNVIKIHRPYSDIKQLHENVLPAECLPSDYGGLLADVKTLNQTNLERLNSMLPYFRFEETRRKKAQKMENNEISEYNLQI